MYKWILEQKFILGWSDESYYIVVTDEVYEFLTQFNVSEIYVEEDIGSVTYHPYRRRLTFGGDSEFVAPTMVSDVYFVYLKSEEEAIQFKMSLH